MLVSNIGLFQSLCGEHGSLDFFFKLLDVLFRLEILRHLASELLHGLANPRSDLEMRRLSLNISDDAFPFQLSFGLCDTE